VYGILIRRRLPEKLIRKKRNFSKDLIVLSRLNNSTRRNEE